MTLFAHGLTRRRALQFAGAAALLPALRPFAWAQGRSGLHALSVFGEFKYPADFAHFDYVNPAAPKGGRIVFQPPSWVFNQSTQTFNTLNTLVLRGDAPPRMEIIFDTLMTSALDEADAIYGSAAGSVSVNDDASVYDFAMRPEARFHDGSPLTAEDVAFSLNLLKAEGHPNLSQLMTEMVSAEAVDAATVRITLSEARSPDTILTLAAMPILSKAFYATRTFDDATLEPPLGSGPYRVGRFEPGRFIEYERVPDYWGRDLAVNVGHANFDVIRIDFFVERQAAFEAFKKGEITHREEFTSITWANDYGFPAVIDGRVRKTEFPQEARPSLQGWFFNTRRPKFADPRTREGLGLAFDFEWTNQNLFFGLYSRVQSYFEKSDFKADGLPGPEELALLEPFRGTLPAEVFDAPAYVPAVTDGSGNDRAVLQRATELLAAAGWQSRNGMLTDANGQTLDFEFLIDAEVYVRSMNPYVENLRLLGVNASIRQVDPSQYQSRLNDYDFDVVGSAFSMSPTPLDGINIFFSTKAADTPGTYNLAGIRQPAVDALIERLPTVSSRAELIAVTRALDRVLRSGHYWVSNWYSPVHRIGHWDVFGWPEAKPEYGFPVELTWWFNRERAAAIGIAG